MLTQYTDWLSGFVTGDLGTSLAAGEPVTQVLGSRIENSAFLVLLAAIFSIPLAIVMVVTLAVGLILVLIGRRRRNRYEP